MAHFTSLVTVAAELLMILCILQQHSSNGAHYLIVPTNSSSCNVKCVDFASFLQNTNKYVTSNSTIIFKPGTYDMSQQLPRVYSIEITGVTNVSIGTGNAPIGDTATQNIGLAQIKCTPNSKVVWEVIESQEIHIQNMVMTECSAEINARKFSYSEQYTDRLQTNPTSGKREAIDTTLLLVHSTNVSLTNYHITSLNKMIITGYDNQETLHITNCTLNGTVRLTYPRNEPFTTIFLYIHNSTITSSLHETWGILYQTGLILSVKHNNIEENRVEVEISDTVFHGRNNTLGTTLMILYDTCSVLSITLSKIRIVHTGIVLSLSEAKLFSIFWRCDKKNRKMNIIDSKFEMLDGLHELAGIPSKKFANPFILTIINCTVSNSITGLNIISMKASLSNNTFFNNSNALRIKNSVLTLEGENLFEHNINPKNSSAILFVRSTIIFKGKTVIKENVGENYAALVAQNSTLVIEDSLEMIGNIGFYGGALSLYNNSYLDILPESNIIFDNNHARKSGGGIYVDTLSYDIVSEERYSCFYYKTCELGDEACYSKSIHFCNNTSIEGGDSIFGGSVDDCFYPEHFFGDLGLTITQTLQFDRIAKFCDAVDSNSAVSSKANRLCYCSGSNILCDVVEVNVTITPGATVTLEAVAIGQQYGVTLATVRGRLILQQITKPLPYISTLQRRQEVSRVCNLLQYTINAPVGMQQLLLSISELTTEDAIENIRVFQSKKKHKQVEFAPEVPLLININLINCYLGFVFDQVSLQCECHPYLRQSSIECVLNNQTIHRSGSLWVNATKTSIIIHRHCPLGYCKTENMELSLSSPDTQCSFDRSGTLCGQCRGDLSQVLGSLNCKECSDFWLFLVIPATLISGVVLVLFLMTLNLTVSTGTINGLIFYANIVRTNNAIFFSSQTNTITTISRVFIAWINLDIGIEMCFYNGLDAYAKTLFQLAFPLYICTIVAIIIISSHYSTLAAKLSGRNAVQVLATLFLLSYSKAIRLVITALSFTNLTIQHYPNNTNTSKPVWLYDGNVDYLQGKHIALFLIGILILVLVSLPYTTILLFSQCLQKISHYKGMSWVWKIKPLFDAYTGPYKNKHRYWTGLLLLVRVILYAIFSLNFAGDPAINLLAICIFMLLTLAYLVSIGRVYKSRSLTILECTFLINLAVLSTSTLYAIHTNRDQEVIINISVILTFIVFCGVLILHTYKRVMTLRVIKKFTDRFKKERELVNDQEPQEQHREENFVTRQVVSIKDLEEPLIEREEIM